MHRSVRFMSAVAGLGLATGVVFADPVGLDIAGATGVPGSSFDINTTYSTAPATSALDFFAIQVVSGVGFESPGMTFEAGSGWNVVYTSGGTPFDTLAASGPASAGTFGVTFKMFGDISDPVDFDVANFSGDNLVLVQYLRWNGSQLVVRTPTSTWNPERGDFDSVVIPLPSTAGLAFVGLGVCCVRRRRTA